MVLHTVSLQFIIKKVEKYTYNKSYNYHLELLSPVALGAIPLHDGLPHIQQEYISIVEAVPWQFHLRMVRWRDTSWVNFYSNQHLLSCCC